MQAATRIITRSLQTTARSRGPVSMKEPYSAKGQGGAHGGVIPGNQGYQNVLKLQKEWAVEDGTMVWQKRGSDKTMYTLTLAGCASGVLYCFYLVAQMSFPKPPE